MLNSETIERLLNVEGPAITIYCPLQPEQRDTRAVEAGFRELVGQANAMLERDGIELRRRDALLNPVRELGIDFTRHRDPTLVVFRSENLMIAEPVPRELPAFVSVGMDFNIKPLLPLLSANRRLFILALSRSQARLLVATPFACEEVPLQALPADAQAELDSKLEREGITTECQVDAERQALMTESLKRIAAATRAAIGTDRAPVVLVADPHVAGRFLKEADIPGMLPQPVPLNPFSMGDEQLRDRVQEAVAPRLQSALDTALDQANARLGTAESTVALRLEEILQAAHEGRVDTLMVASDATLWGKIAPDQSIASAHGSRGPHDEELLNRAVVSAMRTGAPAFAAPRARLPRHAEACALLRY